MNLVSFCKRFTWLEGLIRLTEIIVRLSIKMSDPGSIGNDSSEFKVNIVLVGYVRSELTW